VQVQPHVFRVTGSGVQDIAPRADGGYLVEPETGTVAWYGENAERYLASTARHEHDTEVVVPRDTRLTVQVNGRSLHTSDPCGVLIGAGGDAEGKVEGNPLVLRTERAPAWYARVGPDGEHRDRFDEIARMNQRLFARKVDEKRFSAFHRDTLLGAGVLRQSEPGYLEWAPCKTPEDMSGRLRDCGLPEGDVRDLTDVWCSTMRRGLYGRHSGTADRSDFTDNEVRGLKRLGVVRENLLSPGELFWTEYSTETELRSRLATGGFEDGADRIVSVWKRTTRAGYDNTGLIFDEGRVVAYSGPDKVNLWNQQPSEWILNSTAYPGANQCFTVGVSHVASRKPSSEPVPFKDIRPAEALHRHPVNGDKKQTEGYLVVKGCGDLVTVENGKPVHHVLEAGDMAIIDPGVAHCVLAAQGDYEHLVFQVPSAFQYGFMFKESMPAEYFGTTDQALLADGLEALRTR